MATTPESWYETVTLNVLKDFERVCHDFEANWGTPKAITIEECLKLLPNDHRTLFFRDLLIVELERRHGHGDEPNADEYRHRFPEYEREIAEAFQRERKTHKLDAVPTPKQIGRYPIIKRINRGGQAQVYRAIHPTLDCELVIKVGHSRVVTDASNDKLIAEGKIVADLHHPNIGRIYDLDCDHGIPFIAMEFVRGRNLRQRVTADPLMPGEAIKLVAQLADAVEYAHARGVIHRDIKPENILIDEDGQPRIIDFGMALLSDAWSGDVVGGDREICGTIPFMPPEQAKGELDRIDPRSDVFALGAVLYWLLVGHAPFGADTIQECLRRARNCEFDEQALTNMVSDRQIRSVILKAMAAEQEDRFGSASELARALERSIKRDLWRPVAILGVALVGLLLVFVPRGQGADRENSSGGVSSQVAPQNPTDREADSASREQRVSLDVSVGRGESTQPALPLFDAVPLYSGEHDLQFRWQVPPGFSSTLFWFDTEGELHELAGTKSGNTWYWPNKHKYNELGGAPGNEIIFVCASQEKSPSRGELESMVDAMATLPILPSWEFARFDQQGVLLQVPRELRGPTVNNRTRVDVKEQFESLRVALSAKFQIFAGVVVPHAERAGSQPDHED